jgi:hypothetical protein
MILVKMVAYNFDFSKKYINFKVLEVHLLIFLRKNKNEFLDY